jgi:hypothetical protein
MGLFSGIGRFFRDFRKNAARESRQWMVICSRCAKETSLYDMGGQRYGSNKGSISHAGYRCKGCGDWNMHKIVWRPDPVLQAEAAAEKAAR